MRNQGKLFYLLWIIGFIVIILFWNSKVKAQCEWGDYKIQGRVMVVSSLPDIRVQVVTSNPDFRIKIVESLPIECGEWQFVTSNEDLRIQFVTSNPDIRIQYVEFNPGKEVR